MHRSRGRAGARVRMFCVLTVSCVLLYPHCTCWSLRWRRQLPPLCHCVSTRKLTCARPHYVNANDNTLTQIPPPPSPLLFLPPPLSPSISPVPCPSLPPLLPPDLPPPHPLPLHPRASLDVLPTISLKFKSWFAAFATGQPKMVKGTLVTRGRAPTSNLGLTKWPNSL